MTQPDARMVRRYVAGAIACTLLVAAVILFRSPGSTEGESPRGSGSTASATTGPSATPGPPATPSPSATGQGTEPATPSPSEPPPSPSASGPGLTEPGVLVRARVLGTGDLDVSEQVLLSAPVITAAIAPPQSGTAGALEGITPVIVGLQMTADGQVQQTPAEDVADAVLVDLTVPATRLALRYTLAGAAKRSTPSSPGRAAVALPPVSSVGPGNLPVVVEIIGSDVLNMTCPALPQEEQLCGRESEGVWRTPPIGRDFAVVVAQVNLPDPLTR